MYDQLAVLTLVPAERGRGGVKTGFQSLLPQPISDVRDATNLQVWQEQWRKEYAQAGVVGYTRAGAHNRMLGLTVFARQNTSDPSGSPTFEVISHLWQTAAPHSVFFNHTTASDLYARGLTAPWPGRMETIGQRLFYCDGIDYGRVYDGTANGYSIGIAQPTKAPTLTVVASGTYGLGTYMGILGSVKIRSYQTTGNIAVLVDGQNVYLNSENSGGPYANHNTTVVGSPKIGEDRGGGIWGVPSGTKQVVAVAGDLFITVKNHNITTDIVGLKVFWWEVGVIGVPTAPYWRVVHSTTIVGADTKINFDAPVQSMEATGLSVRFVYGLSGTEVEIAAALPFGADENEDNPISYDVGGFDWGDGEGPGYAYAYYDPITGHMSNISPIAFTDGGGVNEALAIDISPSSPNLDGSIPAFATATGIQYTGQSYGWEARFTHIVFFRTQRLGGGAALFPIGSLDPTSPAWRGITNVPPLVATTWTDVSDDTELLVSDILRAPQYTNEWPQSLVNGTLEPSKVMHMAYWDGRLWVVGLQEQDTVKFSCDKVQCPFGVPYESFPRDNVLRVSAQDGIITGLSVIGNLLVVLTRRWAYYVAGNSWDNYRLIRLSVHMSGVGSRQLTEVPSETDGQSGIMVFLARDRVIYMMQPGQPPQAISRPVQDIIDGQITENVHYTHGTELHYCCIESRNLLCVSLQNKQLIFNLDNQTWEKPEFPTWVSQAFASGFGLQTGATYKPVAELNGYVTVVQSWLASGNTVSAASLETFPLWDGNKARRQVHFIRIYVRQPSALTWGCTLRLDDSNTVLTGTFVAPLDDTYKMIGPYQPFESGLTELICHVPSMIPAAPPGSLAVDGPQICYRAIVGVTFPTGTDDVRLMALQVGFAQLGGLDP